ncbi:MAG: hypothetical protein J2P41_16170, partial [Blastocatellia bacterium]|nr:hypothetical protein [Blastocatellia bacterium]
MSRTIRVSLLCLVLVHPFITNLQVHGQAQSATQVPQKIPQEIQEKIRKEAMEHSQIMRTMHYLTDVYGPRLTGSPSLKAAGEWAIKQMGEWGFENGQLEPWDFGHQGWTNERLSAHIVAPVKEPLTCEAMAWTPGTNGTVTAQVFQIVPPNTPTREELAAYLDQVKGEIKGKFIMIGRPAEIAVTLTPPSRRFDDQVMKERFSGNGQNDQLAGSRRSQPTNQAEPGRLNRRQVSEMIDAYLLTNGALLRIEDGARDHRQIRAFNNPTFDPAKVVPTVYLSNEDYGRISRIMADGTPVELEF